MLNAAAAPRKRHHADEAADSAAIIITRCSQPLYVLLETLTCASHHCISCAHKIVAGEQQPPSSAAYLPNVRPELCPRASGKVQVQHANGVIGLYLPDLSVLTVGDGDLSFSSSLAEVLGGEQIVATTWESHDDVVSIYQSPNALKRLAELHASVKHGVDAKRLAEQLPSSSSCLFDFVVFNFPCIGESLLLLLARRELTEDAASSRGKTRSGRSAGRNAS
jgi:hypothetical protein